MVYVLFPIHGFMTQGKLTPAQRRFVEQFDSYTQYGSDPKDFRPLGELWQVQHRTMNWCLRTGIIKKAITDNGNGFIVNPDARESLGLTPTRIIQTKTFKIRKRLVRISIA